MTHMTDEISNYVKQLHKLLLASCSGYHESYCYYKLNDTSGSRCSVVFISTSLHES